MHEIDSQVKAQDIQPGMLVLLYGTERFMVERIVAKWGAVQVHDGFEWRGLGENEPVQLLAYFNV